jgi:anti-sigma factor RsiW
MNMQQCRQERVLSYVEGELAESEAAEIKKHLRSCAACKAVVEEFKPLAEAIRQMEAPLMRPYEVLAMRQHVVAAGPLERPQINTDSKTASTSLQQGARRRLLPTWLEAVLIILFGISAGVLAMFSGLNYSRKSAVRNESALAQKLKNNDEPGKDRNSHEDHYMVVPLSLNAGHRAVQVDHIAPNGNHVIWIYKPLD